MRERYPAAALVILADLVKATGEPDPHAIEAAIVGAGRTAIPDFGADREPGMTDFNDMAVICGAEAVARVIAGAIEPPRLERQPARKPARRSIRKPDAARSCARRSAKSWNLGRRAGCGNHAHCR